MHLIIKHILTKTKKKHIKKKLKNKKKPNHLGDKKKSQRETYPARTLVSNLYGTQEAK